MQMLVAFEIPIGEYNENAVDAGLLSSHATSLPTHDEPAAAGEASKMKKSDPSSASSMLDQSCGAAARLVLSRNTANAGIWYQGLAKRCSPIEAPLVWCRL
jgi:hypothetical protein